VCNITLPEDCHNWDWIVSPLLRAKETAILLGHSEAQPDERLKEMHFGDWEGEQITELRTRLGKEFTDNEDRGLDLLPPNGESPRMLQGRLKPLFCDLAQNNKNTVAVCHLGVMRATLAMALDWDMLGKPPAKPSFETGLLVKINKNGELKNKIDLIPLITQPQDI
jgi:probable phosphoglycerate mutase